MAILEVVKEETEKEVSATTVNGEMSLLNDLNRKSSSSFDFSKDRNPEMAFGRLKKERGISGVIFSTIINFLFFIGALGAISFAVIKYFDISIKFFPEKKYYTVTAYNTELLKFFLILFVLLIFICFLCSIFINLSIKIRFRKNYLSTSNVYVYDTFLIILNILVFVMIAVGFFTVINNYSVILTKWYTKDIIDTNANLGVIEVFKYIIVVIVAIFISLNSLIGIKITYEKNKFIFENHL